MNIAMKMNEPKARTVVLTPDAGERFTIMGGGVRAQGVKSSD